MLISQPENTAIANTLTISSNQLQIILMRFIVLNMQIVARLSIETTLVPKAAIIFMENDGLEYMSTSRIALESR